MFFTCHLLISQTTIILNQTFWSLVWVDESWLIRTFSSCCTFLVKFTPETKYTFKLLFCDISRNPHFLNTSIYLHEYLWICFVQLTCMIRSNWHEITNPIFYEKKWKILLILVLLNLDISCLCKQCRSRSVGFWRSQLIWICTVCH